MLSQIWLKLAEILVPVLLAITIFVSWQADRRDRAQLATQLAAAQQTIRQAAASQQDRDPLLNQTLVQIAAQKQSATTPAQVLKELPSALPTGAPQTATATGTIAKQTSQPDGKGAVEASTGAASLPSNPIPKPGQAADAILPAADLKPLHDFGLDCKACQAKLAARAT